MLRSVSVLPILRIGHRNMSTSAKNATRSPTVILPPIAHHPPTSRTIPRWAKHITSETDQYHASIRTSL